MPGQPDDYDLLLLYGDNLNCQFHFLADTKEIIKKRGKVGCE
jgi:hypothetical protein